MKLRVQVKKTFSLTWAGRSLELIEKSRFEKSGRNNGGPTRHPDMRSFCAKRIMEFLDSCVAMYFVVQNAGR